MQAKYQQSGVVPLPLHSIEQTSRGPPVSAVDVSTEHYRLVHRRRQLSACVVRMPQPQLESMLACHESKKGSTNGKQEEKRECERTSNPWCVWNETATGTVCRSARRARPRTMRPLQAPVRQATTLTVQRSQRPGGPSNTNKRINKRTPQPRHRPCAD